MAVGFLSDMAWRSRGSGAPGTAAGAQSVKIMFGFKKGGEVLQCAHEYCRSLRGPLTSFYIEVRHFIYSIACGFALALAWVGFGMGESRTMPYLFAVFIAARIAIELLPRKVS